MLLCLGVCVPAHKRVFVYLRKWEWVCTNVHMKARGSPVVNKRSGNGNEALKPPVDPCVDTNNG